MWRCGGARPSSQGEGFAAWERVERATQEAEVQAAVPRTAAKVPARAPGGGLRSPPPKAAVGKPPTTAATINGGALSTMDGFADPPGDVLEVPCQGDGTAEGRVKEDGRNGGGDGCPSCCNNSL